MVKAIEEGIHPTSHQKNRLGSVAAASLLQTPTQCLFDVLAVAFLLAWVFTVSLLRGQPCRSKCRDGTVQQQQHRGHKSS